MVTITSTNLKEVSKYLKDKGISAIHRNRGDVKGIVVMGTGEFFPVGTSIMIEGNTVVQAAEAEAGSEEGNLGAQERQGS